MVINIKITIYYPSDKKAVIRLNQIVANIHADAINSYMQKTNITTNEWDDLLLKTKERI